MPDIGSWFCIAALTLVAARPADEQIEVPILQQRFQLGFRLLLFGPPRWLAARPGAAVESVAPAPCVAERGARAHPPGPGPPTVGAGGGPALGDGGVLRAMSGMAPPLSPHGPRPQGVGCLQAGAPGAAEATPAVIHGWRQGLDRLVMRGDPDIMTSVEANAGCLHHSPATEDQTGCQAFLDQCQGMNLSVVVRFHSQGH